MPQTASTSPHIQPLTETQWRRVADILFAAWLIARKDLAIEFRTRSAAHSDCDSCRDRSRCCRHAVQRHGRQHSARGVVVADARATVLRANRDGSGAGDREVVKRPSGYRSERVAEAAASIRPCVRGCVHARLSVHGRGLETGYYTLKTDNYN